MEIMDKGLLIIPVILFVAGILVSWSLGSSGIELIEKNNRK
jgi:hypothetical protein